MALWRRSRAVETIDADDNVVMREIRNLESSDFVEYSALKELCGHDGTWSLGALPLALIQAGIYIARLECSFVHYLKMFKRTNRKRRFAIYYEEHTSPNSNSRISEVNLDNVENKRATIVG